MPRELVQHARSLEAGDPHGLAVAAPEQQHGEPAKAVDLPSRNRRAGDVGERDRDLRVSPVQLEAVAARIEAPGAERVTVAPDDGVAALHPDASSPWRRSRPARRGSAAAANTRRAR